MAYDTLIFDLDGTLWDACASCAIGWNRALAGTGHAVTADDIRSVAGKPFAECVSTLLTTRVIVCDGPLIHRIDEYERTVVAEQGGQLYDGVRAGLPVLAKHQCVLLVSNCQDWYLECFWQHSGLQQAFKDWDCHGLSGRSKAAMIAAIVERNNASRAIYIGDTDSDERSAREAGVDFAHVTYGFGQAQTPDRRFDSFADLVAELAVTGR